MTSSRLSGDVWLRMGRNRSSLLKDLLGSISEAFSTLGIAWGSHMFSH